MEMSSHHEQGKDHTIHSGKCLRYQLCSLYPSETMKGREVGMKGQRVNFHSTVNCLSISSQEKLYKGCCYYQVCLTGQRRHAALDALGRTLLHRAQFKDRNVDSSGMMFGFIPCCRTSKPQWLEFLWQIAAELLNNCKPRVEKITSFVIQRLLLPGNREWFHKCKCHQGCYFRYLLHTCQRSGHA